MPQDRKTIRSVEIPCLNQAGEPRTVVGRLIDVQTKSRGTWRSEGQRWEFECEIDDVTHSGLRRQGQVFLDRHGTQILCEAVDDVDEKLSVDH